MKFTLIQNIFYFMNFSSKIHTAFNLHVPVLRLRYHDDSPIIYYNIPPYQPPSSGPYSEPDSFLNYFYMYHHCSPLLIRFVLKNEYRDAPTYSYNSTSLTVTSQTSIFFILLQVS